MESQNNKKNLFDRILIEFSVLVFHFQLAALTSTPDKHHSHAINDQSPKPSLASTPSSARLDVSHDSDDEINDSIEEEEDDDDCLDRSGDNSQSNKRNKKTRTVFSRAQVFQLESTFDMKK